MIVSQLYKGFQALLDSAPDAIVIVDAGGRIQALSSEGERMFGYERAELVGKRVEILVPRSKRQLHADRRRAFAASPKRRPMGVGLDLCARRRSGEEFPVEISLSPMPIDDRLLIIAVIRDVSGRRRVEAAALSARALAAHEEERLRIARDLHDELGQGLSGIALGLARIESAPSLEAARQKARQLGAEVRAEMRELRRVAEHLRPERLAEEGLAPSLKRMADDRQEANPGTTVSFQGPGSERRLTPEEELAVYRIVQEAVTNAIKHAQADEIDVSLSQIGGATVASVRDDGCGFDVQASANGGLGLAGMRERAELVKGELAIASREGRGTEVELVLSAGAE